MVDLAGLALGVVQVLDDQVVFDRVGVLEITDRVDPDGVRDLPGGLRQLLDGGQRRANDRRRRVEDAGQCRRVPAVEIAASFLRLLRHEIDVFGGVKQQQLVDGLERLDPPDESAATLEGAAIVTQPATGAVLAMVGGRDVATAEQHFTEPPPRYTEASLIKELEANGVGRPSTYASIISTIMSNPMALSDDRSSDIAMGNSSAESDKRTKPTRRFFGLNASMTELTRAANSSRP